MDNFRRRSRDSKPAQPIDGMLHAPSGSRTGRRAVHIDGLRSANSRRVDEFSRSEGYHVAQNNGVRTAGTTPVKEKMTQKPDGQESLLNMSLPGATADEGKKQKKKKAHAKQGGRWHSIRKWTLRSALVFVVLALLGGGFLFTKGVFKINKVFKGGGSAAALQADVKPELLKGEGDGRINILLLGKGGPGHAGADLTDTLIVMSIDPIGKSTTLVSIPRDTWVTVPGAGSSKINAVYANAKSRSLHKDAKDKEKAENAGIDAIEGQVSQILGIPIHYYGMVDFKAFKEGVDAVGGVDVTVPQNLTVTEKLWDEASGKNYYLNVPAGVQHFDGMRALYFSRSRHTSTRGDFDRTERQRLLISALSHKMLSAGTYTNPVKISQLMSAFGDHVTTDLSVSNAVRLAQITKDIDMTKLQSIGLADPPNNFVITDNINGQSIVRPRAGLGDFSQIQAYIRNTLKDPYIAKEGAKIAVLNGTSTPGLATKKADTLKSYGYNVTVVGDAPTHDYTKTYLVDVAKVKKPFTKNYLEKRLSLTAVTALPDKTIPTQDVDFVIILGQQ